MSAAEIYIKLTHLEIATNVTQKRDVADGGDKEQQEGTKEDQDSEGRGNGDGGRRNLVAFEVLGEVVPFTRVALSQ